MQIGIFDSGIGGITVLHDSLKMLPYEDYIYYADTLHVPYGSKSKIEVKKICIRSRRIYYATGNQGTGCCM